MFNLADYEPVEVRLEKFIKDHPDFPSVLFDLSKIIFSDLNPIQDTIPR